MTLFQQPQFQEDSSKSFYLWYLLALIAGAVNAGGVLACHRFVTHVTGYYTLFGIGLSNDGFYRTLSNLSVPVYYLVGAMISALLVERRIQQNRRPRYYVVMILVTLILTFVAYAGDRGWFGEFGHELKLKRDYLMLSLLCLSMGMQNAVISSASGAVVRTSHMTGMTTDLGVALVRTWAMAKGDSKRALELRAIRLRLGLLVSFTVGGAVGALAYLDKGYQGFYLPALLAFLVIFLSARRR